jgi:hypothetical protein
MLGDGTPERLYFGAATLHEGILRPIHHASLSTAGAVVVADDNLPRAHASALRNAAGLAVGQINLPGQGEEGIRPYLVVSDRNEFLKNLHEDGTGKRGGFIYELDPTPFALMQDPVGQKKWMLLGEPARITKTRFVPLEECMKAGVQIYCIKNPALIPEVKENRRQHPDWLAEKLAANEVEWLNEELGINPIPFPESPDINAKRPARSLLPAKKIPEARR